MRQDSFAPCSIPVPILAVILSLTAAFPAAGCAQEQLEPAAVAPPTCSAISTGVHGSLNGFRPFPASSLWNTNISAAKVDPNSASLISFIGASTTLHPDFGAGEWDGSKLGIPYLVVDSTQPLEAVVYDAYGTESDPRSDARPRKRAHRGPARRQRRPPCAGAR